MAETRFKQNDEELDAQAKKFAAYIATPAVKARLNLSDAEVAAVVSAQGSFGANLPLAREAAEAARIATRNKDAAKTDVLGTMSRAVDLAGPRFTNEDRLACEMPPLSEVRTRHAIPTEVPFGFVANGPNHSLLVTIIDTAHPTRKGKPEDVDDVMIYAGFDLAASQTPEQMPFRGNFSDLRSALTIPFSAADVGKVVYLAARYSNSAGAGPFGAIFQGVVT